MKSALNIGPTGKSVKNAEKAIIQVLKTASKERTSEAVTMHALSVLSKSISVKHVMVTGCSFRVND